MSVDDDGSARSPTARVSPILYALVLVAGVLTWAVLGVPEHRGTRGRSEASVATKLVEYPSLGASGCSPAWSFTDDPVYIKPSGTLRVLPGLAYRGVRDLHALFGPYRSGLVPLQASTEVKKIIWHMAGIGEVRITVTGPGGRVVPLAWGPDFRGFNPVTTNDWGTGLVFDEPGCWHIKLHRYDTVASVWIEVTA
jgi:hypothetical protein